MPDFSVERVTTQCALRIRLSDTALVGSITSISNEIREIKSADGKMLVRSISSCNSSIMVYPDSYAVVVGPLLDALYNTIKSEIITILDKHEAAITKAKKDKVAADVRARARAAEEQAQTAAMRKARQRFGKTYDVLEEEYYMSFNSNGVLVINLGALKCDEVLNSTAIGALATSIRGMRSAVKDHGVRVIGNTITVEPNPRIDANEVKTRCGKIVAHKVEALLASKIRLKA